MECRRAAKPSDEEEIFGAPIRGSEKRGRAFLQTGGPNEGHRRGDAGGRLLPKEHGRVIFVTELQLSPNYTASPDRKISLQNQGVLLPPDGWKTLLSVTVRKCFSLLDLNDPIAIKPSDFGGVVGQAYGYTRPARRIDSK
jgi:hypothetical protein